MSEQVLTVEWPAGAGGLNRTKNLTFLPPTDLSYVEELTVENQAWEKGPGATKFNTTGLGATITGLHDLRSGTGLTQELVAALSDGRLVTVKEGGGVAKTLKSGMTPGGFPVFTEGVIATTTKALFYYDGMNVPQVYTGGVASADINDPSLDWTSNQPAAAFSHNFRTIAFGNRNAPHTAYMSDPQNHGDFSADSPNTRDMAVYPGEWDYLSAGISWRARGYLFKYPQGVYYIDDTDSNIANWQIRKVMDAIGVAGPGCIVAIENDVVVLGSDGYFYQLSDVVTFGGQQSIDPILPNEIGEFIREQLNLNRLGFVQSVYYARKRQLWFALPSAGSSINNIRFIIDLNMPGKIRLLWSTRDECEALAVRRENQTQEPIWGDAAGFVYRGDRATRAKDGAAYNGQYETPPLAPVEKGRRYANLHQLQVVFRPEGNYDLDIEVHRDKTLGQILTFSQQSLGAPVGSFSLDSDVLGGDTIAHDVERLEGEARYVKLVARNTNVNETFAVLNHLLSYTPGRSAMV